MGCKLAGVIAETLESTRISAGASIGVSIASDSTPDVDALLRAADAAMFHAKLARKGTVTSVRPQDGGGASPEQDRRRHSDR